jgi:hypothetical protein
LLKDHWPEVLRGAAGFLAGLLVWWALTATYARPLAWTAEALIRVGESPAVTALIADGTSITVDRADFRRGSPRPGLPLMGLTANVVLLTALFAVNRHPLHDRNVLGFVSAATILAVVHVFAVIANVESIYALRLGPWSAKHYGPFARNFWGAAAHFYGLIGAFGVVFALWWLFRPPAASSFANPRAHVRRRTK